MPIVIAFTVLALAAIAVASLLSALGGTSVDVNSVAGAAILVLGALGMGLAAALYRRR